MPVDFRERALQSREDFTIAACDLFAPEYRYGWVGVWLYEIHLSYLFIYLNLRPQDTLTIKLRLTNGSGVFSV